MRLISSHSAGYLNPGPPKDVKSQCLNYRKIIVIIIIMVIK